MQGAINGKDAVVVQRRRCELTGQREADINAVALVGLPCPHISRSPRCAWHAQRAEERLARESVEPSFAMRAKLVYQHGGREVGQI